MRIAVDAMGGDHAPAAEVRGALDAVRQFPDLQILLVGSEEAIVREASRHGGLPPSISICPASEVITPHEEPVRSFRTKKDASIVVAGRLVKEGEAVALLSAGSTGALVVVGTLGIGRMKGIERPALGSLFPTTGAPVFVLDIGATPDARPEWLVQFALMGDIYARHILGLEHPRIALLNNGLEEEKGNLLTKTTYPLLKKTPGLNFVGNIEGREVPFGHADVVVADGFAGNIFLKAYEGVGMALMQALREALTSSPRAKAGALLARPALREMARRFDYTEYGGALLLGLKAPVGKCHGSSDAKAITSGIRVMRAALTETIVEKLASSIASHDRENG